MTDYSNPDSFWTEAERQFYKDMNDDERIAAAVLRIVYTCLGLLVAVLLCALLPGWQASRGAQIENYVARHFPLMGISKAVTEEIERIK